MASGGLNDAQVQQQIAQMVAFINQEASEKVEEIRAKADEEFNIEKARIVQEETLKINQQFERKAKQVETQKKIEYSNKLNAARLQVLKAQEDALKDITQQAGDKLETITKDKAQYKKLLQDLLTQCLCQLLETKVTVRVRKEDVDLVKSVGDASAKEFKEKSKLEVELVYDAKNFLPEDCGGGVEVAVGDRIKITNTLGKRLELAVQQTMPAVRYHLFGESGTRRFFN
eukprot:m.11493 g.11493  ORF g.11493 m.11493 type:complete len:229 (+) comp9823_c0_seq1:38-724(+)